MFELIFFLKTDQRKIDTIQNQINKSSCWSRFGLSTTGDRTVGDEASVITRTYHEADHQTADTVAGHFLTPAISREPGGDLTGEC